MIQLDIQNKLTFYIEAFEEARQRVGDDQVASVIVQEIAKDLRMTHLQKDRANAEMQYATMKQIEYLKNLGVQIPNGLTRKEASTLIDEARAQ